jgi:hypothetical protein
MAHTPPNLDGVRWKGLSVDAVENRVVLTIFCCSAYDAIQAADTMHMMAMNGGIGIHIPTDPRPAMARARAVKPKQEEMPKRTLSWWRRLLRWLDGDW